MSDVPQPIISQLAAASKKRFHTAMLEGLTEEQAFEEIVRTILECYRDALAS